MQRRDALRFTLKNRISHSMGDDKEKGVGTGI